MRSLQKMLVLGSLVGTIVFSSTVIQANGVLLKQGMQSEDIRQVQLSLKELGYFNEQPTGYYGEITKQAVEKFQKDRNFSVDGVVGPATWSSLIGNKQPVSEKAAIQTESKATQKKVPVAEKLKESLKKGMQNPQVKSLQIALKDLGYFNEDATGYFGEVTKAAVEKFQKDNSMTADGIAGSETWGKLFIVVEKEEPKEKREVVSRGSVERGEALIPWSEASNILKVGDIATVVDINTGKTFKVKRTMGYNHADCETVGEEDTNIMKAIYGGVWNWTRRPIIVILDGRKIAASMSGMPHAGLEEKPALQTVSGRSGGYGKGQNLDVVKGNGMSGHFDIHFLNSRTHATNKVDSDHQAAIKQAAKYIEK